MKKFKIIIFTAGQGHLSLAYAAKSFLKDIPGVEIKIINIFDPDISFSLYKVFYRFMPSLFKIPYELSKTQKMQKIIKKYFISQTKDFIPKILRKEKPQVVISTYFGYTQILELMKYKIKFKYINIISDPITVHPLLVSHKADYNTAFYKIADNITRKFHLNPRKVISMGWLTRKDFFEEQNVEKIRNSLDLKNRLTLLICGGSDGNNTILSLLPTLFLTKFNRPIQIIFITGNNKHLSEIISQSYKICSKINENIPQIIVKGFTNDLHKFMSVSDVVIGKAGPNLLFESVAQKKPFIAISHISGQEDGNLELIKKYNMGWLAEEASLSSKIIRNIILNPKILEKKKDSLTKLAKINYEAGIHLKEIVLKWK